MYLVQVCHLVDKINSSLNHVIVSQESLRSQCKEKKPLISLSDHSCSSLSVCVGRLPVLPVSRDRVHVQTQHVVRGTVSGEDRDWRVLLGSHPLPVLLLALPHSLLPFRGRLSDILKVSEFKDVHTRALFFYTHIENYRGTIQKQVKSM